MPYDTWLKSCVKSHEACLVRHWDGVPWLLALANAWKLPNTNMESVVKCSSYWPKNERWGAGARGRPFHFNEPTCHKYDTTCRHLILICTSFLNGLKICVSFVTGNQDLKMLYKGHVNVHHQSQHLILVLSFKSSPNQSLSL